MAASTDLSLSIITATYNAAEHLPRLILSLQAQTDQDFEWVVADGASTDSTLALLHTAAPTFQRMLLDSSPDFGIYDALNRGVQLSSGTYYLVLGADDELLPDAVQNYKTAIAKSGADFVTAKSKCGNGFSGIRNPPWEWLHGAFTHVSGHAVDLAIKKSLHLKIGWYSKNYPIAADQFFILKCMRAGATVYTEDFLAGNFNTTGVSSVDTLGRLTESCRIQIKMGHNKIIQIGLLFLKIIKNIRSIY